MVVCVCVVVAAYLSARYKREMSAGRNSRALASGAGCEAEAVGCGL